MLLHQWLGQSRLLIRRDLGCEPRQVLENPPKPNPLKLTPDFSDVMGMGSLVISMWSRVPSTTATSSMGSTRLPDGMYKVKFSANKLSDPTQSYTATMLFPSRKKRDTFTSTECLTEIFTRSVFSPGSGGALFSRVFRRASSR